MIDKSEEVEAERRKQEQGESGRDGERRPLLGGAPPSYSEPESSNSGGAAPVPFPSSSEPDPLPSVDTSIYPDPSTAPIGPNGGESYDPNRPSHQRSISEGGGTMPRRPGMGRRRSSRRSGNWPVSGRPRSGPGSWHVRTASEWRRERGAADSRAKKRFLKALLWGLGIWIVLGVILGIIGEEQWRQEHRPGHGRGPVYGDRPHPPVSAGNGKCNAFSELSKADVNSGDTGRHLYPSAKFGDLSRPSNRQPGESPFWRMPHIHTLLTSFFASPATPLNEPARENTDDPSYSAGSYSTTAFFHFEVDGPKDLVSIFGTGRFAVGHVSWILAPPKDVNYKNSSKNTVEIEVVANYDQKRLLDIVTVCQVENDRDDEGAPKGGLERGVQIWTPGRDYDHYRRLGFYIVVRLPTVEYLDAISLTGPLWSSSVDLSDQSSSLLIRNVNFDGTNSPFSFESLLARNIKAKLTNGSIRGTFNVSDNLALTTVNGVIHAGIHLFPKTAGDNELTTRVTGSTTNGKVSLKYLSHPHEQVLDSQVVTTIGDGSVVHHPNFEGAFSLKTTWGKGQVHYDEHPKDPTGKERPRHFEITEHRAELGLTETKGNVWWNQSEKNKLLGESRVETTLGNAAISIV